MPFVVNRHTAPLVHESSSAILRFACRLALLFGIGLALHLTGHTEIAVVPWSIMAFAFLVLPLVAAVGADG